MSRYISEQLRSFVAQRADYSCEYCLLPSAYSFFTFHIDHIISRKHDGETDAANLAYACTLCNRNKGTDLGTILTKNGSLIPFFNPRIDTWDAHFELKETGIIYATSDIGRATVKIFDLNHAESIIERSSLMTMGWFLK